VSPPRRGRSAETGAMIAKTAARGVHCHGRISRMSGLTHFRAGRLKLTRMYGPAVCRKKFFDPAVAVLHQCIRPLIGAFCAPGHHGYQRACGLISGQASMGHLGHQCSHAPGRPILHLVSSSRRPRRGRV
jgi:hypothetical protein